jgi:hypothetical protein
MRWAYTAAGLAFSSAAISAYWTLGGTALLDTVGGEIEELARERSAGAVALGTATVAAKLTAAWLALALTRPAPRAVVRVATAGGILLALYGGVLVVAGALVLAGVIDPAGDADKHALRWHVFFWDLWFVVWGVALLAAVRRRPRRSAASR